MPQAHSERGLATAPIRVTPKGVVADLKALGSGVRMYLYPDGHMNLMSGDTGYPFNSTLEFIEALAILLRKMEKEVRRAHRSGGEA